MQSVWKTSVAVQFENGKQFCINKYTIKNKFKGTSNCLIHKLNIYYLGIDSSIDFPSVKSYETYFSQLMNHKYIESLIHIS